MQEWLIWLARKASVGATLPWVRIPPPPPHMVEGRLTGQRAALWIRYCASRACELRQARKGAAVSGSSTVPQNTWTTGLF